MLIDFIKRLLFLACEQGMLINIRAAVGVAIIGKSENPVMYIPKYDLYPINPIAYTA